MKNTILCGGSRSRIAAFDSAFDQIHSSASTSAVSDNNHQSSLPASYFSSKPPHWDDSASDDGHGSTYSLPFTIYDQKVGKATEESYKKDNGSLSKFSKEPFRRENGISAKATLVNFLKGMIGPGCLSLPLAFRQAGLWTALALVFVFGFLNNYCMLQLVHCSQKLARRKGDAHMNYGTVAYEACANSFQCLRKYKRMARLVVNTVIVALQIGICSVFYVFVALHMQEVVEDFAPDYHYSDVMWMFFIAVPMIMINYVRTLRAIAVLSVIGNFLMITAFLFVVQHLLRGHHQPMSQLNWITRFDGVMAATGSILYSFEGQAMVLPLENKLKESHRMVGPTGVLSVGMTVVSCVYAISGFFGYLTYGEKVRGSITLNLPNSLIFSVVKLMLTLVVFFGFVIQQYVIVDMLWPQIRRILRFDEALGERRSTAGSDTSLPSKANTATTTSAKKSTRSLYELPIELIFRTVLVLITMLIAIAVPNLEQIIPLVGVTAGMALAFMFPAVIDSLCFIPQLIDENGGRFGGRAACRLIQNMGLMAVGLFGLVFGLRSNVESIFRSHGGELAGAEMLKATANLTFS